MRLDGLLAVLRHIVFLSFLFFFFFFFFFFFEGCLFTDEMHYVFLMLLNKL